MVAYLVKRVLWIIPVLILSVVLLFFLDQWTVLSQITVDPSELNSVTKAEEREQEIIRALEARKVYLPLFYFGVYGAGHTSAFYRPGSSPDRMMSSSLHRICNHPEDTERLTLLWHGAYDEVSRNGPNNRVETLIVKSWLSSDPLDHWTELVEWSGQTVTVPSLVEELLVEIRNCHDNIRPMESWPTCKWHGTQNQFYDFVESMFSNQSRSKVDGRYVYDKIWPALGITMLINLASLIVIVILGLFIGQWIYVRRLKLSNKIVMNVIHITYALPLFWIATALLVICSSLLGVSLSGVVHLRPGEVPNLWTFLRPANMTYLILPVVAIILGSLSVVVMHVYRALEETYGYKYVLSAYARGVAESNILKIYQRPYANYTLLTIVGNSIPGLISGSVVVEWIFNLPGMGRLLWDSLYAYDWTVVWGILVLSIVFSVIGQLIIDLLYVRSHPKVQHK